MQVDNFFRMNDWEIKKFLKVVLAIQFALWGLIGMDALGLQIPILRQFIGFIYLTFVPGIIILRILKLHKLGNIETLLYAVGLSIATLMFTGLFMNTVYPLFGLSGPISTTPLIITISGVVLILCILSYVRDKDYSNPSFLDIGDIASPPALFLCLIPFLAIFGTYLMNFYNTNILLLILLPIICFILILVITGKIPQRLYPLAIWVIGISLLFHFSLISRFLLGTDVLSEYFYSQQVLSTSHWDPVSRSVLSTTILPVVLSKVCFLDLTWVYKVVYPFFFSLTPLGAYYIYNNLSSLEFEKKDSFFAVFLIMSVYVFYHIMPGLAKQSLATLFYILVIMTAFVDKGKGPQFTILLLAFSVGLIFSHYGMSYLLLVFLVLIFFVSLFFRQQKAVKAVNINWTFVSFFCVSSIAWYMYTEGSFVFTNIISMGENIISNLAFLGEPTTSVPSRILSSQSPNFLHTCYRYLYYITVFMIAIGGVTSLIQLTRAIGNKKEINDLEYRLLSLGNFAWLVAYAILPAISYQFGFYRVFHITSLVLAPFFIVGFKTLLSFAKHLRLAFPLSKLKVVSSHRWQYGIATLLMIFLLFNSGFVFEIAKDPFPTSIPLSLKSAEGYASKEALVNLRAYVPTEQDVAGALWLKENRMSTLPIYATFRDLRVPALEAYALLRGQYHPLRPSMNVEDGYIYMWYINTQYKLGATCPSLSEKMKEKEIESTWPIEELSPLLSQSDKIYSNRISQIYYVIIVIIGLSLTG